MAANALRSERHLKERARREARRCSPRGSSTSSTHSSGSPAHKGADFRLLCARCLPRVRQVPSPHSAGLVRARAQTHRVDGIVVARRRRADGARTLPLRARRRGGQRAHHAARVPRVCARLSVSACEPRGRALPRTIARRAFASARRPTPIGGRRSGGPVAASSRASEQPSLGLRPRDGRHPPMRAQRAMVRDLLRVPRQCARRAPLPPARACMCCQSIGWCVRAARAGARAVPRRTRGRPPPGKVVRKSR